MHSEAFLGSISWWAIEKSTCSYPWCIQQSFFTIIPRDCRCGRPLSSQALMTRQLLRWSIDTMRHSNYKPAKIPGRSHHVGSSAIQADVTEQHNWPFTTTPSEQTCNDVDTIQLWASTPGGNNPKQCTRYSMNTFHLSSSCYTE